MRKISFLAAALGAALISGLSTQASAAYISASGAYNGEADISGAPGKVSSSVYRIIGGNKYFTVSYKHTAYDFSGIDDPFDSLNYFAVDARYDDMFTSSWGFFSGLTLGTGFEDDIHLSDSYAISPRLGLSYKLDADTQVFVGGVVQFNEVDDQYLPVLGIKFGDESHKGWSGSIAYPATKVTYRPLDSLAFEGVFLTVRDLYQLSDDSNLINKGYIFEESYGVSAGVVYTPVKLFTLRAGLQSYFDREYKIYDAGGHELDSYDVDPSAGFYFNGSFNF